MWHYSRWKVIKKVDRNAGPRIFASFSCIGVHLSLFLVYSGYYLSTNSLEFSRKISCFTEMADSVVAFVLDNLSRLLEDEHKLLSGVEDKINSLCNELKFIDIFLKNSEGKRSHEMVKEVVSQIRDVAHKAEDVVDTYVSNIAKQKQRSKLSKLIRMFYWRTCRD